MVSLFAYKLAKALEEEMKPKYPQMLVLVDGKCCCDCHKKHKEEKT